MDVKNRREELIDATMQIVAETGLASFSMKKVTNRVGVGETLIYKYFETKENLFYICFESLHKQIGALFENVSLPAVETPQDIYMAVHTMWSIYLDFLIKNSYRTLFYFEYRDSPYVRCIRDHDDEARDTYFHQFVQIFLLFDEKFHIREKTNQDHFWTYILDTTGIFARRIIRGELPDTPESRENVWRLLSGGILGLLAEEENSR